jgi:hypothetical protein
MWRWISNIAGLGLIAWPHLDRLGRALERVITWIVDAPQALEKLPVLNPERVSYLMMTLGTLILVWGNLPERYWRRLPRALQHLPHPSGAAAHTTGLGAVPLQPVPRKERPATSQEDLDSIHISIRKLEETCAQGAEAFQVLETRAKIKYLERMQESVLKQAEELTVLEEGMPRDKDSAQDWLSSKSSLADSLVQHLAQRLQDVGFNGIELMQNHLSDANMYARSKAKFHSEPDFLDVSPELKMHYHSCMKRLDMMRTEYDKVLNQLRSKADIGLRL